MSNLKTIMFDLGRVVIYTDFKSLYKNFALRIGLSPEFVANYHKENSDMLFTGEISMEMAWDEMEKAGGKPRDRFTEIWNEEGLKARRLDEDMLSLIKRLRQKYKVGAVSNLFESRMLIDEKTGVYDNFDFAVLSCKVHLKKPDTQFFDLALKVAKVKADEALFIDDKERYIQAAKDIGIRSILYNNLCDLETVFKELGVVY